MKITYNEKPTTEEIEDSLKDKKGVAHCLQEVKTVVNSHDDAINGLLAAGGTSVVTVDLTAMAVDIPNPIDTTVFQVGVPVEFFWQGQIPSSTNYSDFVALITPQSGIASCGYQQQYKSVAEGIAADCVSVILEFKTVDASSFFLWKGGTNTVKMYLKQITTI